MKKALVISYNTFPTEDSKKVEGTGLRYWRLACAIKDAGHKVDLAILEENKPNIEEYNGIRIKSFNFNYNKLEGLLKGYDVIIFSYAFGQLTKEIIDRSPKTSILIADAMSPYYVEALTKSSSIARDTEISKFYKDYVNYCNYALVNSDYIMVAASKQKELYTGVMAGQGILGNFNLDRIITVPAYPEYNSKKIDETGNKKMNIVWFGGMYPWFDAGNLIKIFSNKKIAKLAKLTVIGAVNPFYSKTDERFNGYYYKFKEESDRLNLTNKSIFFEDWVNYNDRISVFNSIDLAISINANNLENKYSFRLRVADLAGNNVPVVTNGGDPLGEELISRNLAFKFDFLDQTDLSDRFEEFLLNNREDIVKLRKKLSNIPEEEKLSANNSVGKLLVVIENGSKITGLDSENIAANKLFHLSEDNKALKMNINELLVSKKENIIELETAKQELETAKQELETAKQELDIIYKKPYIYLYKKFKKIINRH